MPAPIYGNAELYDDDELYGSPEAASAAVAAGANVRSTGLRVRVRSSYLNLWELFAGAEINSDPAKTQSAAYLQTYWSYRNAASICKLDNGNIVRVRLGDGTLGDRQIYSQTITDPTNASQWTSWSVLHSGDNFGVAVVANGNTPVVYHTTAAGLAKDGAVIWAKDGLVQVYPVIGQLDAVFVIRVSEDTIDTINPKTGSAWKRRRMDLWYTPNGGAATEDPTNYRWYRNGISAALMPDGTVVRYQTNGMFTDPRAYNTGDSITYATMPSSSDNSPSPALLIRGMGAQVGHNTVAGAQFYGPMSDGFYYLFYDEFHSDVDFESIVSPGISVVWQRSLDLKHWSEPTFTGFQAAIGGLVEKDDWVYFAGNGAVWRRPQSGVLTDYSNYVPTAEMEIPRDNQEADGQLTVANPAGVNDALITSGGQEIEIQPGIQTSDGSYFFKNFHRWWVKNATREIEGSANRIRLEVGDVWSRLNNPLRDSFNWIGQTSWSDWAGGLRNKKFNYFFVSDTDPREMPIDNTLKTWGICLFTGWRGHNAFAQVSLINHDGALAAGLKRILYYRWVDADNHYRVEVTGAAAASLIRRRLPSGAEPGNGVDVVLGTGTITGDKLTVDTKWSRHIVRNGDGTAIIDHVESDPGSKPGYVGFNLSHTSNPQQPYRVLAFTLQDYEAPLTTGDLLKTALAMADYHDGVVGDTESTQFGLVWGPQTDIPTPADALRTLLEGEKLTLVWKDDTYQVGKFLTQEIVKTLQDEIIETDHQDEAKRRINLALVDGNADTWIEVDALDTQRRGFQVNAYYDAPELLDLVAVKARAQEEIRQGSTGSSPGGTTPLQFDLSRMECITWIDNVGNSYGCRIQGFSIDINQSTEPYQRQVWDLSLLDFEQP